MATAASKIIRPQPGPQESFLSTPADIAIYGGSAGSGKSFGLLIEPVRHHENPQFGGVIFRRTSPQIRNEGGLWDESFELYPLLEATPKESSLEWEFSSGARIRFAHMEHEKNRFDWQGSQIPFIGFDELPHFTEKQFFYMVGRNRSTCGVRPYLRATCNPDPDSFVRRFIDWWIGPDGFPIKERSGVLRWMVRCGDTIEWFNTRELALEYLHSQGDFDTEPLSVTFIAAKLTDNQILMKKDPGYLSKLKALPYVDRMQLLEGNWNVRATAGNIFRREWFKVVDAVPAKARRVRVWDFAATVPKPGQEPDYSAGGGVAHHEGITYLYDMRTARTTPKGVEDLVKQTAELDGRDVPILLEQEPGSSGKIVVDHYIRVVLQGWNVKAEKPTGQKMETWKPLAAQAEAGNVRIVRGPWNESFLLEAEAAPEGVHDDQLDVASKAYAYLTNNARRLTW